MDEEIAEILEPIKNGYRVLKVNLTNVPQGYLHVNWKGKMYWMHMDHLEVGDIKQKKFTGEIREKIIKLAAELQEVLPRTYEEWEENLRGEPDPEREIGELFYISKVFTLLSNKLTSLEEKKELIALLFECSLSSRNKMLKTFKSKYLTEALVTKAIKQYYEYNL